MQAGEGGEGAEESASTNDSAGSVQAPRARFSTAAEQSTKTRTKAKGKEKETTAQSFPAPLQELLASMLCISELLGTGDDDRAHERGTLLLECAHEAFAVTEEILPDHVCKEVLQCIRQIETLLKTSDEWAAEYRISADNINTLRK